MRKETALKLLSTAVVCAFLQLGCSGVAEAQSDESAAGKRYVVGVEGMH